MRFYLKLLLFFSFEYTDEILGGELKFSHNVACPWGCRKSSTSGVDQHLTTFRPLPHLFVTTSQGIQSQASYQLSFLDTNEDLSESLGKLQPQYRAFIILQTLILPHTQAPVQLQNDKTLRQEVFQYCDRYFRMNHMITRESSFQKHTCKLKF